MQQKTLGSKESLAIEAGMVAFGPRRGVSGNLCCNLGLLRVFRNREGLGLKADPSKLKNMEERTSDSPLRPLYLFSESRDSSYQPWRVNQSMTLSRCEFSVIHVVPCKSSV